MVTNSQRQSLYGRCRNAPGRTCLKMIFHFRSYCCRYWQWLHHRCFCSAKSNQAKPIDCVCSASAETLWSFLRVAYSPERLAPPFGQSNKSVSPMIMAESEASDSDVPVGKTNDVLRTTSTELSLFCGKTCRSRAAYRSFRTAMTNIINEFQLIILSITYRFFSQLNIKVLSLEGDFDHFRPGKHIHSNRILIDNQAK